MAHADQEAAAAGATRSDWDKEGLSALHRAAEQGDAAEAQRLIEAGADVEVQDQTWKRQRPLHYAAEKGHVEVLERLLAAKATVEAEDVNRLTPWELAKKNNKLEAMALLRPDLDEDGLSALHRAARDGDAAEAQRLIEAGEDVELQDQTRYRQRPLHYAAEEGHVEVLERLLAAKATVDAEDRHGRTPWDLAKENNKLEAMALLRPDLDEEGLSALHRAAWDGDAAEVQRLIEAGADVELQDKTSDRQRPLHYAADKGHVEVLERLLAAKATVDAEDEDGRTPWDLAKEKYELEAMALLRPDLDEKGLSALHRAARDGDAAEVQCLIEAGADVELQDKTSDRHCQRPLHYAAEEGHVEVLERLLAAKATVDAEDRHGRTPWDLAKEHNKLEAMALLRPDLDEEGRSALHRAAQQGDAAEVQRLIEAGADVELQDRTDYRHRPLHLAALMGRVEVLERLLAAKATVEAEDRSGHRPLHYAAENGNVEVLERLLAAKATVEAEDGFRRRPLHLAAEDGRVEVLERLLAAKATVDAEDEDGRRPLHYAAKNGRVEVLERLLAAKATVEAEDRSGKTPFDLAKEKGKEKVMGVLRPVRVLLLSGDAVPCDPQPDRTVRDLREEVQKKLKLQDTEIQLIASAGEKLRDEQTLGEARVSYSGSLTAEIVGQDKDLQKAPDEAMLGDSAGSGFGEQPVQSESMKDTEKNLKKVEEELLSTIGPEGLLTQQRCVTILTMVGFTAQESKALLKDYAQEHEEISVRDFVDLLHVKTAAPGAAPPTQHEDLPECGEVVHSPSGITFFIPTKVTQQRVKPTAEVVRDLTSVDLASLQKQLEPNEAVFHPVFRLAPHDTTFQEPIWLIMPACVGASKVWQSSEEGWTEVTTVSFQDGYIEVQLQHFCLVATTGVPGPIKAIGFLKPGPAPRAKLTFCHIGCTYCYTVLNEHYSSDPDYLLGYVQCPGLAHVGNRQAVEVSQQQVVLERVNLDSHALPIPSTVLQAEPTSFIVDIENQQYTFNHPNQAHPSHVSSNETAPEPPRRAPAVASGSSFFPILSHELLAQPSSSSANIPTPPQAPPLTSSAQPHTGTLSTTLPPAADTAPALLDIPIPSLSGASSATCPVAASAPSSLAVTPSTAAPPAGPYPPAPDSSAAPVPPDVPPATRLMIEDRSRSPNDSQTQVVSSSRPRVGRLFFGQRNRAAPAVVPIGSPVPLPSSAQVPRLRRSADGARIGMFSARFDGGETEKQFRAIHQILVGNGYEVLMVSVKEGQSFGIETTRYLGRLKRERGVMLCVCTEHYAEMTASQYSSFEELKFAKTYAEFIKIVPLKVAAIYPPRPPCRGPQSPDHRDEHMDAQSFVDWVFSPDRLRLECMGKSEVEIAEAIAVCLHER